MGRWKEFMQLYISHEKRLYGFIMSLVPNWSDVDDIIQETAIVLWSKFDEFQPGTDFTSWALTIAKFQIMKYRKNKKLQKLQFGDEAFDIIANQVANNKEETSSRSQALKNCLSKLKQDDKTILELRYQPGQTTKSVADKVGRSVHAIYKVLNRIHMQLFFCIRQNLNQREI